jgi:hypothetical protein
MRTRLLNKLFEDENFLIDEKSVAYIIRDIINMNWWNTCDYLLGYQNNKRINLEHPTFDMKLIGLILKEFYRHWHLAHRDAKEFEEEMKAYIEGTGGKQLRQLKLFSMKYRRNESQYFYKNGKPTWLDCTSRATYAWKYVGQNGFMDFDGVCRVLDGEKIIRHCEYNTEYPDGHYAANLFDSGVNKVKEEIFSQRERQFTVSGWVKYLGINVLESRKWLFDLIKHVKTDPYKNNEKKLLSDGKLLGNNELHYGYKTPASSMPKNAKVDSLNRIFFEGGHEVTTSAGESPSSYASYASRASRVSDASNASNASNASSVSDASRASDASYASHASYASRASRASNASSASNSSSASDASYASHASRASDASYASRVSRESCASRASSVSSVSNASNASNASRASDAGVIRTKEEKSVQSWFDVPAAIGKLQGLDHPPVFKRNKFGIAGHWKINKELVDKCDLGWFEPFFGHGESALYAKKMKKNFVGIEVNPDSMNGYLLPYVQKAVNKCGDKNTEVKLILGDSMVFRKELVNKFDLCYTSPPYFDFEDYGFHNKVIQECFDYDEYHRRVTVPVFKNVKKYLVHGGILALQTEKNKGLKQKWIDAITSIGFELLDDAVTGQEKIKYSQMSKKDQTLLIFKNM